MGIGSTLQHLLDKNNSNVNEVAVATGVSPSTLYRIIKRDSMSANIEDLYKVAHYLGVALDYFYVKKGLENAPELFSAEEKALVQKFRRLDPYARQTLCLLLDRELAREPGAPAASPRRKTRALRLVRQPAGAGDGVYLGPEAFEELEVASTPQTRRASFALRVCGDGMAPVYHDGDVLLVADEKVSPDDIAVVTLRGEGFVKRVGNSELHALNEKAPAVPRDGSVRVHGRVIGALDPAQIVG